LQTKAPFPAAKGAAFAACVVEMSTVLAERDELAEKRRRGVRITAIVCGLVAAFFYFGFIVMTLIKGSR
jgi:hypothetical protein